MTASSGRAGFYATVAAAGLLLAVATGRPALAGAAAPFAVALVAGLAFDRRPPLSAAVSVTPQVALVGDPLEVSVRLESPVRAGRVEVRLHLPPGVDAVGPAARAVTVPAGGRTVRFELTTTRWGAYRLGGADVRVMSPAGVLSRQVSLAGHHVVRVYPRPEYVRNLVRPGATRSQTGSQTARVRAEGVEFADLRPYQVGDRWRDVNWRATARRGRPWVNQRHPERNSDVVVFLDVFSPLALDRAVQAAGAVVTAHLADHDRVGLIAFGGALRWLTPEAGRRQQYRLLDALIESQVIFTYATRDVTRIPRQLLPPGALIIAVSPLEDPRAVAALSGLRARGSDVAVIEVDTAGLLPPPAGPRQALARRLWDLEREAARRRYRRLGIPVAQWDEDSSVAVALEELRTWRRRALRVAR